MKFITETGCCNSSLRRTCLYIGIICSVLSFMQIAVGYFWGTSYIMIISNFVFSVGSLCLIVAAVLQVKILLIPWFLGYLFTVMAFFTVFLGHILGWLSAEDECQPSFFQFLYRLIVCVVKLGIETFLFRYVASYYLELRADTSIETRPVG